jgi:CheY-like chemotaxis protein
MAMRILMADDDSLLREFTYELLSGCGHEVDVVENGKELLAKLIPDTYDAIITDYRMPVLNGLETLRQIRSDKRYEHLPVIVCSGDINMKEEVCRTGGIFVQKPVLNADDFFKKL